MVIDKTQASQAPSAHVQEAWGCYWLYGADEDPDAAMARVVRLAASVSAERSAKTLLRLINDESFGWTSDARAAIRAVIDEMRGGL